MSELIRLSADTPAGLVTSALRDRIDPSRPPMLIGAEARDILHSRLGHSFRNKATQDVDLAFAIPDWQTYATITDGLVPIPDTGIAFRVAGIHVDLMAFGSVEAPRGTITPPFREADPLDVFGMSQVYESACPASFGDDLEIRLPTVAGYVALKLKAWIDRSAVHNQKDAPDLALALFWAAESRVYNDRFWGDIDLVSRWEGDVGLGGAALMGADARAVLGTEAANHLADLFTVASREELSRSFRGMARELLLGDSDRRLATLAALTGALRGES